MKLALMCTKCFKTVDLTIEERDTMFVSYIDAGQKDVRLSKLAAQSHGIGRYRHDHNDNAPNGYEMVVIDYHIADIISKLNQLGYYTAYSCEGHVYSANNGNVICPPYVYFQQDLDIEKKTALYKAWMKTNCADDDKFLMLEQSPRNNQSFSNIISSADISKKSKICIKGSTDSIKDRYGYEYLVFENTDTIQEIMLNKFRTRMLRILYELEHQED